MKKFFIVFFLLTQFIFSSDFKYNSKDIKVLKQLDINEAFIKDSELNHIFKKYSKNSHIHNYVKNIKSAKNLIISIKDILEKKRLPKPILFMPMTESNFKVNVKSSLKAAGPWQFLPSTARIYNLDNNKYVDERLDFLKSTNAATRYLKDYYKKFGKWYLAVLAYNCGEGRVIEAIARVSLDKYISKHKKVSSKILSYKKIIDKYIKEKKGFYKVNKVYKKVKKLNIKIATTDLFKVDKTFQRQYLPQESRTYLRKIIAFSMLNNRNFFYKDKLLSGKSNIVTFKLKKNINLKKISKKAKMSLKQLKNLNPHLKKDIIPKSSKRYSIYLPKKNSLIYEGIKALADVNMLKYTVKRGDTISQIANKYKVNIKAIKYYNNKKRNVIKIGEVLNIPLEKKFRKYLVKKGDSLLKIAYKFDVNYKRLKKINKLNSNRIKINQKIIVPIKNRS